MMFRVSERMPKELAPRRHRRPALQKFNPRVAVRSSQKPKSLQMQMNAFHKEHLSSSASPEPQVEEEPPAEQPPPEPSSNVVPLERTSGNAALDRVHQKLNNETELYKLHLKHYHMSPTMFKHRTSALTLPKEIHDK